jgi:hypothetical protein
MLIRLLTINKCRGLAGWEFAGRTKIERLQARRLGCVQLKKEEFPGNIRMLPWNPFPQICVSSETHSDKVIEGKPFNTAQFSCYESIKHQVF